jgi:hypothetical protein
MPDEHPAVAAAEQVVRNYQNMLRSALLFQIREYKQELDDLADDEPDDIRLMAWDCLQSQIDLYRQILGEDPDY